MFDDADFVTTSTGTAIAGGKLVHMHKWDAGEALRLIEELGYEAYFLTVWDLVRFARRRGILCQGRGSAANSAVCYCLEITEVDPTARQVSTRGGRSFAYDFLVVATGCRIVPDDVDGMMDAWGAKVGQKPPEPLLNHIQKASQSSDPSHCELTLKNGATVSITLIPDIEEKMLYVYGIIN